MDQNHIQSPNLSPRSNKLSINKQFKNIYPQIAESVHIHTPCTVIQHNAYNHYHCTDSPQITSVSQSQHSSIVVPHSNAIKIKPPNYAFNNDSVASTPRSIVGDLPFIPKSSKEQSPGMRKNRSAPALSSMQQYKVEEQLYLHPTQMPRSFSANFSDFKPGQALNILMELPMGAYMGIGGGSTKLMLQKALKAVNDELKQNDFDDDDIEEEEEENRIDSINQSQAIPTAPDSIPPTSAIEHDMSAYNDDLIYPAPPSPKTTMESTQKRKIPRVGSRAFAETMKKDIETALQQGYTVNLVIAVLQALIGAFLYGWNVSILNIPQNVVQNDQTKMSDSQYALLQSLFCAGGLVGALCAGPLQDRIGRKKAFIVIDFVFLISAALTYLYAIGLFGPIDDVSNYVYFWTGRFIGGIACGAATAVVPTYLGEISPPLVRGAIGTSNQLTICFSVVIVQFFGYKNILGGDDNWQYLFFGNALPLIQLFTLWSFPESPKWLVQKGRDSEARKALQRLRMTKDVRVDMMLMKGGTLQEQQRTQSQKKLGKKKSIPNDKEPLLENADIENGGYHISANPNGSIQNSPTKNKSPFGMERDMWLAVKWATIIAIALMFMQQFSGINAVFFYSATILNKAGVTSDSAVWLGSLGISTANFFAVFIAVFSIDRAGRKLLLIISCFIMIAASIFVSIAIMFENNGAFWQYSSIGFLILFVIGFEVGLGAIPWLMMAELAPMQYRGVIVAIATGCNWGANLLIAQFSGQIIASMYFYPFAVVCALGALFTMRIIPETNGKTAGEIQKELTNI